MNREGVFDERGLSPCRSDGNLRGAGSRLHIGNMPYMTLEHGTKHPPDRDMTPGDYPEPWGPKHRRSWPPHQPGVRPCAAMDPVR